MHRWEGEWLDTYTIEPKIPKVYQNVQDYRPGLNDHVDVKQEATYHFLMKHPCYDGVKYDVGSPSSRGHELSYDAWKLT